MHTESSGRHWMHLLRKDGAKVAHMAGHMLHEKSFWGILAILAMIALLVTLVVLFGTDVHMQEYGIPIPYGY
ncbi:MAG: hypothetical protein U9P12_08005 [Verrucomicrobiota bacterium]|nr:hypothetical protein [Verrucomicrobiota bacterium]